MLYYLLAKGSADDHVRVINHHTSSRVLLRGFKKCVEDVNFESFKSNQLACVDSEGTLFVFDIFETEGNVKYLFETSNLLWYSRRLNFVIMCMLVYVKIERKAKI